MDPSNADLITIGFDAVPNLLSGSVDAAPRFWSSEAVALELEGEVPVVFRPDEYGAPPYPSWFSSPPGAPSRGGVRCSPSSPGRSGGAICSPSTTLMPPWPISRLLLMGWTPPLLAPSSTRWRRTSSDRMVAMARSPKTDRRLSGWAAEVGWSRRCSTIWSTLRSCRQPLPGLMSAPFARASRHRKEPSRYSTGSISSLREDSSSHPRAQRMRQIDHVRHRRRPRGVFVGEVLIDGDPERRAGRCGYMPQRDLLMPWKTVGDNVAVGRVAKGIPRHQARSEAVGVLSRFGLGDFAGLYPRMLSGGMRQRGCTGPHLPGGQRPAPARRALWRGSTASPGCGCSRGCSTCGGRPSRQSCSSP